jgi:protein-S-isoprenylcysteine O-methyltransferase Ste14
MSLGARAILQSLAFFFFLGLLLFVPAGTLAWLEGWAFLGVVALSSTAISVWLYVADRALFERRLAMGDRGERDPAQRRVQRVLGLACIAMMVVCGLDRRFGWSHVPLAAIIAADAFVGLAFAGTLAVFRANTFASSIVEVTANQRVITTGPYALVRHPMYSAALVMLAATPIALGSFVALVVVPLFCGAVALRVVHEEELLTRDLAGYADYTQKTRYRLVPLLW